MTSIKEIVGIDTHSIERLQEVGVRMLEQLLEQGATSAARMRLADETTLDDSKIKHWVHQADLMRVNGVRPELAHLLCQVGVFTVPKLAYRSSDSLHAELVKVNRAERIMGTVPKASELHEFIARAKSLPKLVRH